jgi:hypothetical protein
MSKFFLALIAMALAVLIGAFVFASVGGLLHPKPGVGADLSPRPGVVIASTASHETPTAGGCASYVIGAGVSFRASIRVMAFSSVRQSSQNQPDGLSLL